ncbi:hypothetical protein BDV29DRAFT_176478 [Aspergillus leporis]|uniref:Uncharacterized protein n=1 Tax=Aspergillus leporis TaxID=41062 RepID=A0A5N5X0E8_9EURO|nr:hypothetical protein BDV29DRAFT_176478 [Aspergillus leporis]
MLSHQIISRQIMREDMSFKRHLEHFIQSFKALFADCALYLPAKDSWSEEYNFPQAPMAGADRRRRRL